MSGTRLRVRVPLSKVKVIEVLNRAESTTIWGNTMMFSQETGSASDHRDDHRGDHRDDHQGEAPSLHQDGVTELWAGARKLPSVVLARSPLRVGARKLPSVALTLSRQKTSRQPYFFFLTLGRGTRRFLILLCHKQRVPIVPEPGGESISQSHTVLNFDIVINIAFN